MKPTHSLFDLTVCSKPTNQTVNQWVYQTLRQAIMCGQIKPGETLTLRGLATHLAVSAMPVRESINRLSSEGAVVILDNRRVMVPKMTPAKWQEIHDLRINLEPYAAVAALPFVQPHHIEALYELDAQVDASYMQDNPEQGTLANQAFHRYLYHINPNQVSVPLIESLWLQAGPFWRMTLSLLDEFYQHDRHQEAIQAIEKCNAFALARAIEADIRDGIAALQQTPDFYHYLEQP